MSETLQGTVVDTLIVGAGLSGIGSAVHLRHGVPDASVLILEARERIGGTWDLFRYPGVRSDSDMHTLGYAFKPWEQPQAIASGEAIRNYVQETAEEHGVDRLMERQLDPAAFAKQQSMLERFITGWQKGDV